MRFYPLTDEQADGSALAEEFRGGRQIGVVSVGESHLFFRVRLKTYYIGFGEITRCYRRVLMVPARMCCGRGNLNIENLVIESGAGELAQIQLPGERAGVELIRLLKQKMPGADFRCPAKAKGGEGA